jgi:hypothetical protein
MDSYNVNRKVATFGDFSNNIESEKEELKKVRRSTVPNSDEHQQHIGNGRYKFNKVTRKMDDLSPEEVQDKLDSIEELDETNELFNFNKKIKDKSLNLLKDEIDSSFKEVAVVNFDKTGGDKNNSREPSLKEVIGNIEQVISKWKIYMSR